MTEQETPGTPAAPPSEADEQLAAEIALARLEDRIGAFTSYTLAADFLELREILAGSLARIKDEDWARRTDHRPGGWTVRQTLAHLEAVAHTYNSVVLAGLDGRLVSIPNLARRSDLKTANALAIEARAGIPPAQLCQSLLDALSQAAHIAAPLGPEQLGRLVEVPFFGATPTVAELLGASLIHAGIIHGAQIAVRGRPIWIFFQPGMMRRQLTRFFHAMGLSYWPERGGDLHATLGFRVTGQGGGSWIVRAQPSGGSGKIGVVRTTDASLEFASADLLCRVMTFQTRAWRHVLTRRLRLRGNLRLITRLGKLFTPT